MYSYIINKLIVTYSTNSDRSKNGGFGWLIIQIATGSPHLKSCKS